MNCIYNFEKTTLVSVTFSDQLPTESQTEIDTTQQTQNSSHTDTHTHTQTHRHTHATLLFFFFFWGPTTVNEKETTVKAEDMSDQRLLMILAV